MKGKQGDKQRIQHMLDAIAEIEHYTFQTNFPAFIENSMMRFACIKQMEIIGEAANYVSAETIDAFPDIPWRQIIGLRHILVHEYFGVDNNLIWQIISKDLPSLKLGLQNVLATLDT